MFWFFKANYNYLLQCTCIAFESIQIHMQVYFYVKEISYKWQNTIWGIVIFEANVNVLRVLFFSKFQSFVPIH